MDQNKPTFDPTGEIPVPVTPQANPMRLEPNEPSSGGGSPKVGPYPWMMTGGVTVPHTDGPGPEVPSGSSKKGVRGQSTDGIDGLAVQERDQRVLKMYDEVQRIADKLKW